MSTYCRAEFYQRNIVLQIAENSAVDSVVGNLTVTDPDNAKEERQFYTCEVVNNVPFKVR